MKGTREIFDVHLTNATHVVAYNEKFLFRQKFALMVARIKIRCLRETAYKVINS